MVRNACVAISLALSIAQASPVVRSKAKYEIPGSAYTVHVGQLRLPARGYWEVAAPQPGQAGVSQIYLAPPAAASEALLGKRMGVVRREERIKRGQHHLRQLYWPCHRHAVTHNNTGPASVDGLDLKRSLHLKKGLERSPWYNDKTVKAEGPFVYLLPIVKFEIEGKSNRVPVEKRRVLALELRPYVDDGKHWVLYTNNQCVREDIDLDVVKAHGLTIRPVLGKGAGTTLPDELDYTLFVLRSRAAAEPIALALHNAIDEATLATTWDAAGAPVDASVWEDLKRARLAAWQPYLRSPGSPVMSSWASAYKGQQSPPRGQRQPRAARLSAFALLGGRAAVRETLQMEAIRVNRKRNEDRTIAIETLKGVEVKSHPYEAMLAGKQGGELALANIVPADRFFLYVAKPSAVPPFLDKGAPFLARLGGSMTQSSIQYDLKSRYLRRLGVTEPWVRTMMTSGAITELALVCPDLFFIDGTDVTVAARLAQPQLISAMLKLVGVAGLAGGDVVALDAPGGRKVYWALRNDLLLISTNRDELDGVLNLVQNGGQGSLGRSTEFRYMLTKLPVTEATRGYAYFSDPFIRRLVGPRMKIAQLRRVEARAAMELLTAGALRAKLDGLADVASLEALEAKQYVPERYLFEGYYMGPGLVVHNDTFGAMADMATLQETPASQVTPEEAKAYERYMNNYTRYWRRFFDPIAVRLIDHPEGGLEAETFILPLVDNTAYNSLKGVMLVHDDKTPLPVPRIEPDPVLMLSLNLGEKAWQDMVRNFTRTFTRYTHVSPAILDDFGPSLHLAMHDADPVIALGSGDAFGPLGMAAFRGGRRNSMMFIPVLVSVLTRPCSLMIETGDPGRTRRFLREAANAARHLDRRNSSFSASFSQLGDRDAWMLTFNVIGMAKLRYGIEVVGNMLVVRNIPWSTHDRITRVVHAPLNGAMLHASPGACQLQLPGLHASAQDTYRAAAAQGMSCLYPLVASGHASVDNAAKEHAKLFGFAPMHPGPGQWRWRNGTLISSLYGSIFTPRQPEYEPGDTNFGLMQGVARMSVNMQFEDDGLRTAVRWTVR